MAEKLLYIADICPSLEQVRGTGMAEAVRRDGVLKPCGPGVLADDRPEIAPDDPAAGLADKKKVGRLSRVQEFWACDCQVLQQIRHDPAADRYDPVTAALPFH